MRQVPKLFCLPKRHVGYTNFGSSEFANSIRAYCMLWNVIKRQGLTPYLDEEITRTAHALRRIQTQPRQWWHN